MKQLKKLSLTLLLLITAAASAWAEVNTIPEVTISQDAETKQYEASFKMPQYDLTATYTIKRDMRVDMAVTVQDANGNRRFRVQEQGNSFVPVDMTLEQVAALISVHDACNHLGYRRLSFWDLTDMACFLVAYRISP